MCHILIDNVFFVAKGKQLFFQPEVASAAAVTDGLSALSNTGSHFNLATLQVLSAA